MHCHTHEHRILFSADDPVPTLVCALNIALPRARLSPTLIASADDPVPILVFANQLASPILNHS